MNLFPVLVCIVLTLAPTSGDTLEGDPPILEVEPNNRLQDANMLGLMPSLMPIAAWGKVYNQADVDVYRVDVRAPCVIDLRVITGAVLMPAESLGGTGGPSIHTPSFQPVVRFFGPSGRLIHIEVSEAPNLLMLDLPVPLQGQSFYVEISALGGRGAYGLQVSLAGG